MNLHQILQRFPHHKFELGPNLRRQHGGRNITIELTHSEYDALQELVAQQRNLQLSMDELEDRFSAVIMRCTNNTYRAGLDQITLVRSARSQVRVAAF